MVLPQNLIYKKYTVSAYGETGNFSDTQTVKDVPSKSLKSLPWAITTESTVQIESLHTQLQKYDALIYRREIESVDAIRSDINYN